MSSELNFPQLCKFDEIKDVITSDANKDLILIFCFHLTDRMVINKEPLPVLYYIQDNFKICRIYKVIYGESDKDIWTYFRVPGYPWCLFFKNRRSVAHTYANVPDMMLRICKDFSVPMSELLVSTEPKSVSEYLLSSKIVLIVTGAPEEKRNLEFENIVKKYTNDYKVHYIGTNLEMVEWFKCQTGCDEFPQLYKDQCLIGSFQYIKTMDDEVIESLLSDSYYDRILELINSNKVMVFMKGTPEKPQCGYSEELIELFKEIDVPFVHFNILEDMDIRQKLKTFSDWPTYPQVYYKGKLVGGIDLLKSMHEDGSLKSRLTE